jgi:membrane fusion protein, adhesin transport system
MHDTGSGGGSRVDAYAAGNGAPGGSRHRLPEIRDGRSAGGRLVGRAVSLTLGVLGVVVALALVLSFTVHIDVAVRGSGVLEPERIWPIRSLEAGVVREIRVGTGDAVREGEPVLRLDTLLLGAALAEAEARYRSGEIDLRKASSEAPLERRQQAQRVEQAGARLVGARAALLQRMVESDLGTNVDSLLAAYRVGTHIALDQAVAEVRSAEAEGRLAREQVARVGLSRFDEASARVGQEQLDGQIRTLRERLRRLDVTAPVSGVVLTEQVERLLGASVREGEVLLEMADTDRWRAVLFVREADVHRIRIGDPVKLEVLALRTEHGGVLGARVAHVAADPAAAGEGGAGAGARPGTYRVIAELEGDAIAAIGAERLRRGYSVQGRIITRSGRIADVLRDRFTERFVRNLPW